jgi:hypothetical protein
MIGHDDKDAQLIVTEFDAPLTRVADYRRWDTGQLAAAAGGANAYQGFSAGRRQKWRRGTQECVRHGGIVWGTRGADKISLP